VNYDFVVLGGGSAGFAAARTAAGVGLKTCVIEGAHEVGGLCILRGCMPSKSLIESANRFRAIGHAPEFGLRVENATFDTAEILARKRRLIDEFAEYRRQQLNEGNFDFIRGTGSFIDTTTVRVRHLDEGGEETVTAKSFRSRVTIVQRSAQIAKGFDEDAAKVVEQSLRKRGVNIFTKTKLLQVESKGTSSRVIFEHEGARRTIEAAAILNALGRKPKITGLGLKNVGVELAEGAIAVNAHQQTSVPTIFAAGDCCGPFEIVHIAIEQGERAARNAARLLKNDPKLESMDYRLKLYVVFTEPQVAVVGLSESEAKAKKIDYLVASYPFCDHGKSIIMDEMDGFVKLLADKSTREILGASVVGPDASELIHEVVVAMRFRATAGQLATTPHYHPTLSEIWLYPAEELAGISPESAIILPGTHKAAPLVSA
jgi:pyruvate/2-oxoglutarate dehydrogenase complex dihydrolipoamide dehydrogenase (E3) component